MKKLLLALLLFVAAKGMAQPADTIKNKLIPGDSISIKLPAPDSAMRNEEMERNVANLLRLQKSIDARKTKEKRNALTRIGIGVALLIILIIGLRRKTVKK
jgi:hypothetical protein